MIETSNEDYWSRKERYAQLTENSAIVWHKMYESEKLQHEELQERYDFLVKKLRYQGKERATSEGDSFLRSYARDYK